MNSDGSLTQRVWFFGRTLALLLLSLVGLGCDSDVSEDPCPVLGPSEASYFPLEVGNTWSYHYRSHVSVAGPWPSYEEWREGTATWEIIDASACTAGTREYQLKEQIEGTVTTKVDHSEEAEVKPFQDEEVHTLVLGDSLKLWFYPDPVPWRTEQPVADTLKLSYYEGGGEFLRGRTLYLVPDAGVVYQQSWEGGKNSFSWELELINE